MPSRNNGDKSFGRSIEFNEFIQNFCILVLSMHDAQTIEVSMKIKLNLLHYVS